MRYRSCTISYNRRIRFTVRWFWIVIYLFYLPDDIWLRPLSRLVCIWNAVMYDIIRYDMIFDTVPGMAWYIINIILLYHVMIWYGMVWYGTLWCYMVWYGMIWYDMVWYTVWYYVIWHGMTWYGMVWYSMVRYGMVSVSYTHLTLPTKA